MVRKRTLVDKTKFHAIMRGVRAGMIFSAVAKDNDVSLQTVSVVARARTWPKFERDKRERSEIARGRYQGQSDASKSSDFDVLAERVDALESTLKQHTTRLDRGSADIERIFSWLRMVDTRLVDMTKGRRWPWGRR